MADMLATPEDLAALLQQDLDRATATLLIEGATALVQETVGQRIVRASSTLSLMPAEGRWLQLPVRPVASVESVKVGGQPVTDWALQGQWLYRVYGWLGHDPLAVIEVQCTHGYAPDAQELQLARSAVLTLAAAPYTNPGGATRTQIGDYSVAYEAAAGALEQAPYLRASLLRAYGSAAGSIAVGSVHGL